MSFLKVTMLFLLFTTYFLQLNSFDYKKLDQPINYVTISVAFFLYGSHKSLQRYFFQKVKTTALTSDKERKHLQEKYKTLENNKNQLLQDLKNLEDSAADLAFEDLEVLNVEIKTNREKYHYYDSLTTENLAIMRKIGNDKNHAFKEIFSYGVAGVLFFVGVFVKQDKRV